MQVYELLPSVINTKVSDGSVGCYTLGYTKEKKFIPEYSGRSDRNLKTRLLQHAKKRKYKYFVLEYTSTLFEAYRSECRGWHSLGMKNKIHPDSPNNLNYICPYCMTKKEFQLGGLK